MVICDSVEYNSQHILQIVTKAKKLAIQSDASVSLLCIGKEQQEKLEQVISYGADEVILCEQDNWPEYNTYCEIATLAINQRKPKVVLFPASRIGKTVASLLSTRFESGLTADCIDIMIDDDNSCCFSRAALNDSVIAKIKCMNCSMSMGTIKKDVFKAEVYKPAHEGTVVKLPYQKDESQSTECFKVVESIPRMCKNEIDLNHYSIIFCVGRGVENKETVERIFALANRCGAGVAGTRAVVEAGLIEKERQIGQSGKSIAPNIYVSFGVSGATQHMVGIRNAKLVIAINSDEKVAIFDYADYSIVEDLNQVLDTMESMLENNTEPSK